MAFKAKMPAGSIAPEKGSPLEEGAISVQDDASHRKARHVRRWFAANRGWLEVHGLPPY